MRKKILIALVIVLLVTNALFVVCAANNVYPRSNGFSRYWLSNPSGLYRPHNGLPGFQFDYELMLEKEIIIYIVVSNFIVLVLVPIFIELILALFMGLTRIKAILSTTAILNIIMLALLYLWVYITNIKAVVLFLVLHLLFSIKKYSIYTKAYEYIYPNKKVKKYTITACVSSFMYFMLIF